MTRTSEYVSLGHPDKVADFVVSYLLDRYIERDANVRFALECQIKDNYVTLGGEVTSASPMSKGEICKHVRDAICKVGYTPDYVKAWGEMNCINPDNLAITANIGHQSPDIAQGVNRDGWGDQGIFWGMATSDESTYMMPRDHFLAKLIGTEIYERALEAVNRAIIGLDVKTQVTIRDDEVTDVIVAVPTLYPDKAEAIVKSVVSAHVKDDGYNLTINGTGAYVRHASQGDCGTTGRKLAVDFYGGNCLIGGGCPWGKDPSKADVTLNIYARHLALEMWSKTGEKTVYCAISSCIGKREISIVYLNGKLQQIAATKMDIPASEIIEEMGLKRPVFAAKCRHGLFV